ncbi:MAG: peptidylprolyl isomerase [Pyrinomonadaceae bacterium]
MRFYSKILILSTIVFSISVLDAFSQRKTATEKPKTDSPVSEKKANQRPVEKTAEAAKADPFEKADVKILTAQCVTLQTAEGNIELEFFPESAPESVRNFLNLAATGSLDTTVFSRIVPDFVIQGGNLGTSEKWSNELAKRANKFLPDEPNQIKHERGILSMARSDEPNSATTHFFILLREATTLDGKFAAFGRVINGMDTVEKINKMPVEGETPKNPVRIIKAVVAPCTPKTAVE